MKKIAPLIFLLIFTSCEDVASNRQMSSVGGHDIIGDAGGGNGNGAVPGSGSLDPDSIEEVPPQVEIRHLVEPKIDENSPGGFYTRKLTIPKNYDGLLHVAGINISSLATKNLKVRFRFGLNASPITVPATIATAAGLTPQTNVEVLVMDFRSQPFKDINLNYDLYDYNDYTSGILDEPVQYNRDDKLFCRGLKLEHDPTFNGQLANGCADSDDICKYSFAKVVDKGLVRDNWLTPILPTEINVASSGYLLDDDSNEIDLQRCLPDNPATFSHTIDGITFPFSAVFDSDDNEWEIAPGSSRSIFDGSANSAFYYQGPYQSINLNTWQIGNAAVIGKYGIFGDIPALNVGPVIDNMELQFGIRSKLFPLATKMQLPKDVEYMGSADFLDVNGEPALKEPFIMPSNGETQWMDGCNARVSSMVNDYHGEHVGSCNVTATIEIVALEDDGTEKLIDATNEVKLQLVKPEVLDTDGDNVLLSSFQSCSSSNQCGSGSCCINKRCWSKDIVSQCVEDLPTYGNALPGDSCQSDNECGSLCCNQATGKCAVHDSLSDPQVLCSKPSGQSCIAKEWCMKHPITQCFIVSTGFDAQGQKTCALRCYTYEEFGDCKSSSGGVVGVCVPPEQPEQPVFNPADPNRCDEAIEPSEVPINN